MYLLALILAWPMTTRPIAPLDAAAACVRVGDAEGALSRLAGLAGDAAAVLRARALLQLGRIAAAEATWAQISADPALAPLRAELGLALAQARPTWDPARPAWVAWRADALLATPEITDVDRWTARLWRAMAWRFDAQKVAEARAELMAIAEQDVVPSLQAPALEALATADPPAADADQRLLVDHGATAEGRRALRRLDAHALTPKQRLRRARRLFSARAYDLAEIEYRAVEGGPERQEALLRRATLRLRLYESTKEAIGLLALATTGDDRAMADEARYRLGIALGRQRRWRDAAAQMARLVDRGRRQGRYALTAAYQVGRLAHQAGDFREAARRHTRFLRRKRPDHAKWQWFLGWAWLRAGEHGKARREFRALADSRNLLVGAKALYWTARSQQMQGQRAKALATLETLSRRAPHGYYGTLGAALAHRIDPRLPATPPRPAVYPLDAEIPDLRPWIERLEGTPAAVELGAIARLIAAGSPERAEVHAARLPGDLAAQLGAEHGAFERTLDHALERFGRRWRADARRRLPWEEGLARRDPDVVRSTYPLAWLALVEAAGAPHGVSRWWLLGHMLQESRFKNRARSHAGAMGPMQVLPRTGRRIAARLGVPAGDFLAGRLFEPGIALRHAAWYLAALRHEFGGNLPLAIAAYNGGPRRFAAHVRAHAGLPFDMLVEEIGAHESRNYLRKVSDHLVRWALIYGTDAEREALLAGLRPPDAVPQARGEVRF